jgi:hypothetical protein
MPLYVVVESNNYSLFIIHYSLLCAIVPLWLRKLANGEKVHGPLSIVHSEEGSLTMNYQPSTMNQKNP